MKKSIIAALSLIVTASGALTSCTGDADDGYFGFEISKVKLVPVQISRDKWSFIDSKGEIYFEDEFKNEPTLVYNDCFSVEESNGYYTVYRVKGDRTEVVGTLENLTSVGYYEEGLIPATEKKERIAVYDKNGEMLYEIKPVAGKEIVASHTAFSDGMLAIRNSDGKWGFIDKNGEPIVKPAYSFAGKYVDGLALVEREEANGNYSYRIIDRKGETVFKLKDGQVPVSYYFNHGYIIVKDSDRYILYDKKGEPIKFSSKFAEIYNTNGKYVIFGDGDGGIGVATMEGENVIRPKYNNIYFYGNDFLGFQYKEVLVLDTKDQEKMSFDYEYVIPYGSFGLFASNGNHIYQLGPDGKEKCNEFFNDINISDPAPDSWVTSDK